jgi:tRNA 2-thiocytidine biosynthesis protein TtcA
MDSVIKKQIKLEKKIFKQCAIAVTAFSMIEEGDVVMVCLSGGADSYTMLTALMHLKRVAPISFKIIAVNLDQKQPGFPEYILPEYLTELGVDFKIVNEDTYSIVTKIIPEGKTTCGLCSRLRRGILYRTASELGATKIALGHHKDDIVETLFLNMFFGGKLKSMPPKLISDDKKNIVIRPLAYCRENDIKQYSEFKEYPIIPCNLCGSQENLQRQNIKKMLNQWDKETPGRVDSIFNSIQNIVPSHLADLSQYDFNSLETINVTSIPNKLEQKFTLKIK